MSHTDQKRFALVDVSAFAHMAWHAYPDCFDRSGKCNKVLSGILSKIRRLEKSFEWDRLVGVMDPDGGSLFRKGIFPEYKANRPEPDADFVRQKQDLPRMLGELGLSPFLVPGEEADDVMASLAMAIAGMGHLAMIVSPDKDMAQMVDEHPSVVWVRPVRGEGAGFEFMDSGSVRDKFGVWPAQIPDLLAMMGDSSDNIPGIPRVGGKTAAKLLEKYGTVEGVITHASEIPGAIGESVRASMETLPVLKRLTTLSKDLRPESFEFLSSANRRGTDFNRVVAEEMLPRDLWDFAFLSYGG